MLVVFVFVALRLERWGVWLINFVQLSSPKREPLWRSKAEEEEEKEEEAEAEEEEQGGPELLEPLLPTVGSSGLQTNDRRTDSRIGTAGGTAGGSAGAEISRLSRRVQWSSTPEVGATATHLRQWAQLEGTTGQHDAAADLGAGATGAGAGAGAFDKVALPSHSSFMQSFRKWKALTTLMLITYSVVTETCMSLLRCVRVASLPGGSDGGTHGTHSELRLLLAAQQVKCFQPWQNLLVAIVVMVLGPFPLVFFFILRRRQRKEAHTHVLTDRNTQGTELAILHVLEGPFKQSAIARNWELVVLLRRFALLAVHTTLVSHPFWLDVSMSMCNFAILVAHLIVAPYKRPLEQQAETISLSLLVFLSVLNFGTGVEAGVFGGAVFSDQAVVQMQQLLLVVPLCVASVVVVVTTLEKRGCIRPGLLSAGFASRVSSSSLLGICVMRDDGEGEQASEELSIRNQLRAEKELRRAQEQQSKAKEQQLKTDLETEQQEKQLLLLELGELRSRVKPFKSTESSEARA
jgi:hypothetical protein